MERQLDESEIKRLVAGLRIVDALNFPLFNTPPKKQKAWWIYKDLLANGYREKDFNRAYNNICDYFEKRTRRNQSKLFSHIFSMKPTYENISLFSLDYRSADISDLKIQKIADYIFNEFRQVQDPTPLGLTPFVVFYGLKRLFTPRYDQEAKSFDMTDFRYKVREHFQYTGPSDDVFLDPVLNYIASFNPRGKEDLIGQIQTPSKLTVQNGVLGGETMELGSVKGDTPQEGFHDKESTSKHLNQNESVNTQSINYGEQHWILDIQKEFKKKAFPNKLPDLKVREPGRIADVLKLWNGTRRWNFLMSRGAMDSETRDNLEKLKTAILQQAERLLKPHNKKGPN